MILPITVVWDFNPVFFSIGSFDIRYYGLMWVLAILGGMLFFDQVCKREGLPQKVSESIFVYGTLATILGARLGHCFFYEPGYFLAHPWAIITDFRNGGMASHGAAVGLLIGLWLFSRKNKLPYIWSLDRIMVPVAIGGAIVRLGNLFNSEIVGGGDRCFLGVQVRPALSECSYRLHPRATSDPALRSVLLPGDFRNPLLALLRARPGTASSGRDVRRGADRDFPDSFFHRVHQVGSGGFRAGYVVEYGTVVEYSVHSAGDLYDLPGHAPLSGRSRYGAGGSTADCPAAGRQFQAT